MSMNPTKVTDLEMAFGGGSKFNDLMPKQSDIPEHFKDHYSKHWANKLVTRLFFEGGSIAHLVPKDGIDKRDAINHIRTILGSFQPKHEHKEAACAYLFDLWFENPEPLNQPDKASV